MADDVQELREEVAKLKEEIAAVKRSTGVVVTALAAAIGERPLPGRVRYNLSLSGCDPDLARAVMDAYDEGQARAVRNRSQGG